MAAAMKPLVLWISLFEYPEFWRKFGDLFANLAPLADLEEAKTYDAAIDKLNWSFADVIIITDDTIARADHLPIWKLVLENVYRGAKAFLMGCFGAYVPRSAVRPFFDEASIPWEMGPRKIGRFAINFHALGYDEAVDYRLPFEYRQDTVILSNVGLSQAWYVDLIPHPTEEGTIEAPVAVARRGQRGYVAFVGDIEGEPETLSLIVAMCRMP
ncbi:hypothetical protein GQ53DRAFT_355812 [Thozetella sp. PMI_491]|nr:hypothetical protein GQ53DRAFT_355812 [Thozetella sp. PMI_491]